MGPGSLVAGGAGSRKDREKRRQDESEKARSKAQDHCHSKLLGVAKEVIPQLQISERSRKLVWKPDLGLKQSSEAKHVKCRAQIDRFGVGA